MSDSCQGYGPPGNARRNATPFVIQSSSHSLDHVPPRWRMAIELTGCLRSLNVSSVGKVHNVLQARTAGYAVDLFCALEACSDDEVRHARAGVVDAFSSKLSGDGGVEVANCTWWPHSAGVLDSHGKLKPEHWALFPGYPYRKHHENIQVDNTLAQAHKLMVVGEMRRRFSHQKGQRYDLVWRQRPDYVSQGVDLESVRDALLAPLGRHVRHAAAPLSSTPSSASSAVADAARADGLWGTGPAGAENVGHRGRSEGERSQVQYAVPGICMGGAHTDIEALLTPAAADHYGMQWHHFDALYNASGHLLYGPEVLIDVHMRSSRQHLDYLVMPKWQLYRCSLFCFNMAGLCGDMSGYATRIVPAARLCCKQGNCPQPPCRKLSSQSLTDGSARCGVPPLWEAMAANGTTPWYDAVHVHLPPQNVVGLPRRYRDPFLIKL